MPSIFKRGDSPNWYASWNSHDGFRLERSTRTTDKRLAERIGREWENRERERAEGLVDPRAEAMAAQQARPLEEHLDEYAAYLDAKGTTPDAVALVNARLARLFKQANTERIGDLSPSVVMAAVQALRAPGAVQAAGLSNRTANEYVRAARSFSRWLVRERRASTDELASLSGFNAEADRRRVRRDMTPEEVARVIRSAESSPHVKVERRSRDDTGALKVGTVTLHYPERGWAYRIATETGFRAGEIASLTPAAFDLSATPPTIRVGAAYTKNRREAIQPIRPSFADALRPWLAGKPATTPLGLLPNKKAASVLRADLDAARSVWIEEASDADERAERERSDFLRYQDSQGRYADFHAMRVAYVSRVLDAGASVKEAMELSRHSDPRLTMKTYARVRIHSLARVLDNMPTHVTKPCPEVAKATGTFGRSIPQLDSPQNSPQTAQKHAESGALTRAMSVNESRDNAGANSLKFTGLRDIAHTGAHEQANDPGRIRTCDPRVRSTVLYPAELRGRRPDNRARRRVSSPMRPHVRHPTQPTRLVQSSTGPTRPSIPHHLHVKPCARSPHFLGF